MMKTIDVASLDDRAQQMRSCRMRALRILSWRHFSTERGFTLIVELALFLVLAGAAAWPVCSALAAISAL